MVARQMNLGLYHKVLDKRKLEIKKRAKCLGDDKKEKNQKYYVLSILITTWFGHFNNLSIIWGRCLLIHAINNLE